MSLDFDPAEAQRRLMLPPSAGSVDLISDLHLAADHPRTTERFERFLHDPAWEALVILGDLFEVWVGDDVIDEPGFERGVAEALRDAAAKRPIWLMHGNRDFLVGSRFFEVTAVKPLPDPSVLQAFGQHWLLTHGDILCLDDVDYQRFRQMVRNPAWQRELLQRPLAERRVFARGVRNESEARKDASQPEAWSDVDIPAANRWLDIVRSSQLIHGHTHRPGQSALGPERTRHVLSDWDLDDAAHPRAEALRLTGTGLARIDLVG
jgi:UDP-2,3-diacylglucosamine hydrolase